MMLLQPWWLLLLLLPFFIHRYTPAYRITRTVVKAPFYAQIVKINGGKIDNVTSVQKRTQIQKYSLIGAWILLVICIAEPVLVGQPITEKKSGRDLMVALDMSKSMNKKDFSLDSGEIVSRWVGLKSIVDTFASQRQGDRLGLVAFGSGAYLMVPFTDQITSWRKIMNGMSVEIAGPATAIGDAIGLSIKAFEKSNVKDKVIILVTDGSDNASLLPPVEAAKVAKSRNITIYTLAIGNVEQQKGQDKVDTKTLQQMSEMTGGKSFIAQDKKAVSDVLKAINKIEPNQYQISSTPNYQYLYPYIISAIMAYYFLMWTYLILSTRRKNR